MDLTESTLWKVTPLAEDGEDADELYRDLVRGGMLACPVGRNIDFSGCETRGAIQALLEKKTGRASHDEAVSAIDQLVNQMRVGDLAILVDNHAAVRAVGRVAGDYAPESPSGQHRWSQIRPVAWVPPPAEPQPWSRFARKAFLSRPLYRIDPSLMKMDQLSELTEQPPAVRNYVLVIDEIGRGDVASIFGELVTLIEPDKRSGGANPLAVTLPLSGEPFAVPDNLYIIGTLNSSDPVDPQSSDILQRRFEFDERCPEASLIRGDDQLGTIPDGEGGRIDLRALMMTINRRCAIPNSAPPARPVRRRLAQDPDHLQGRPSGRPAQPAAGHRPRSVQQRGHAWVRPRRSGNPVLGQRRSGPVSGSVPEDLRRPLAPSAAGALRRDRLPAEGRHPALHEERSRVAVASRRTAGRQSDSSTAPR